jgi:hypothetical protein
MPILNEFDASQLLAHHDAITPFSPLLPLLFARRDCAGAEVEPVLFIAPAQFECLFSAIESDYVAVTMRGGQDGSKADDVNLLELRRASSGSKNIGFQIVSHVTSPCDALL